VLLLVFIHKLPSPMSVEAAVLCFLLALLSARASTAAGQEKAIRFAAIGDFGMNSWQTDAVERLVVSWEPDFIITTGDNDYGHSVPDGVIGRHYANYIRPYTGRFQEKVNSTITHNRFFPSIGNHEWECSPGRPHALPYVKFFHDVLPRGPGGHGLFYDFVRGPVHFIVIDSNEVQPGGSPTETSEQARWVKSVLELSTSPHRVVYFHHPLYTSKGAYETRWMRWPFAEWGASVLLHGHVHWYERLRFGGLDMIVNGVGGANMMYDESDPSYRPSPYTQKIIMHVWGAQLITANSTTLTLSFITIDGKELDRVDIAARYENATAPTDGDL
jgi:tartrate-resistant acid phosphatase type 5